MGFASENSSIAFKYRERERPPNSLNKKQLASLRPPFLMATLETIYGMSVLRVRTHDVLLNKD